MVAFLGNGSPRKTIALFCRANSSATCHKELSSISLELYGTVSWQRRRRDASAAGRLSRSSSGIVSGQCLLARTPNQNRATFPQIIVHHDRSIVIAKRRHLGWASGHSAGEIPDAHIVVHVSPLRGSHTYRKTIIVLATSCRGRY